MTYEYIYDDYTYYITPHSDPNKEIKKCTDVSLLNKEYRFYERNFDDSNKVIKIYEKGDDYIVQDKTTDLDRFYDKADIRMLQKFFEEIDYLSARGIFFPNDMFYSFYIVDGEIIMSDFHLFSREDPDNKTTKACLLLLETLYNIKIEAESVRDIVNYLKYGKIYDNIVRNSYLDSMNKIEVLKSMKKRWDRKRLMLRDIDFDKFKVTKDGEIVVHGYTMSNEDFDTYMSRIRENMSVNGNTIEEAIKYATRKSKVVRYRIVDICQFKISKDPVKIKEHVKLCYVLYKLFLNYYYTISKHVKVLAQQISIDANYEEIIITSYDLLLIISDKDMVQIAMDIFKEFMYNHTNNKLYSDIVDREYNNLKELLDYVNSKDK